MGRGWGRVWSSRRRRRRHAGSGDAGVEGPAGGAEPAGAPVQGLRGGEAAARPGDAGEEADGGVFPVKCTRDRLGEYVEVVEFLDDDCYGVGCVALREDDPSSAEYIPFCWSVVDVAISSLVLDETLEGLSARRNPSGRREARRYELHTVDIEKLESENKTRR